MNQHPKTLHLLARILVGVEEADRARDSGSVVYELLLNRVCDQHREFWAARRKATEQ